MRSCFCCIITSLVAQEYFSSNEALKELNEREGSFLDEFQMQLGMVIIYHEKIS